MATVVMKTRKGKKRKGKKGMREDLRRRI